MLSQGLGAAELYEALQAFRKVVGADYVFIGEPLSSYVG